MEFIPKPPTLFFCYECQVYFYSFSKLEKPTHNRCTYHRTRKATQQENEWVQRVNNGTT